MPTVTQNAEQDITWPGGEAESVRKAYDAQQQGGKK